MTYVGDRYCACARLDVSMDLVDSQGLQLGWFPKNMVCLFGYKAIQFLTRVSLVEL